MTRRRAVRERVKRNAILRSEPGHRRWWRRAQASLADRILYAIAGRQCTEEGLVYEVKSLVLDWARSLPEPP